MSKKDMVEKPDNKMKKASAVAKKAGDKALNEIAQNLPHGAGKQFLVVTKEIDDIEEQIASLNKKKRGCRAKLKEMKIDLTPYDHVRKLRKMEPEDMKSFEASVALYKEQLSMSLSVHQEVMKKELEQQREAARDAMLDASGGDMGKEIGSNAHGSTPKAPGTVRAAIPERNENFNPAASRAH